nr:retrovirus-related Pol polyprotein from transposon TNT 1-94 [Tanacetum cinerariifolium]
MANFLEDIQCVGSKHHEIHEMHDDVQPNCVVVSDTEYTGDSNMFSYDQYVKDNAEPVVRNNASSVSNDASMIIINEMPKLTPSCDSVKEHTKVVDASLTVELAIYKEQVEMYERRAKFGLTVREQKIIEQLRIVITDRKIKEEDLKKELHFVKMQLQSTINHNKSIVEEDTLEIAKITRKKMKEKMKTPLWANNKINIRPPDYSKKNLLATFTPQTQLTPEQIFLSKDVLKMKTEALAEQAKAAKLVRALTVYPPNTPVKLVPRVIPTKSQVKINVFALIQLFWNLRRLVKRELHQRALTKEIKEIKVIFDELEAEVDKNVVNRKCDEIERKNLLITNDTLIANCLSKEVFYIATNSELNVSRFSEMHDAHTVVQARCLELETELSKLKDKIQKDDNDVLETRNEADRTLDFRALDFQITQLTKKSQFSKNKISFLGSRMQKLNSITRNYSVTPRVLAPGMYGIDIEPIPPLCRNNKEVYLEYLKHLKESVATIHEIVEEARVERTLDSSHASACVYTKRSEEIVEYVVGTWYTTWKDLATISSLLRNFVTPILKLPSGSIHVIEDLGKLQPTADVGIFVGYALSRKGYRIYNKRTRRIMETIHVQFDELSEPMDPVQPSLAPQRKQRCTLNSGLVPQPPSPTPNVPPIKNGWDTVFLPMFEEYFKPSPSVSQLVLIAAVQEPVVSTSTPSSTRIDQNTPSISTSQTIKEAQSHVIPTSVEEADHDTMADMSNPASDVPAEPAPAEQATAEQTPAIAPPTKMEDHEVQ